METTGVFLYLISVEKQGVVFAVKITRWVEDPAPGPHAFYHFHHKYDALDVGSVSSFAPRRAFQSEEGKQHVVFGFVYFGLPVIVNSEVYSLY